MKNSSLCVAPGLVKLLRYTPLARERSTLPWKCAIIVILAVASSGNVLKADEPLYDILTPYPLGKHGSTRTTRDVTKCQHFVWENRTYEVFQPPSPPQWADKVKYDVLKFADVVHKSPLRRRYAVGSIAKIENPYYTFSVLEPKEKGGCTKEYFSVQRSTVQESAKQKQNGCRLAANAGYFNMYTGECLGNIVSEGRIVKSTNGSANANFGIREDGSIVVGYISEDDIRNKSNPFRQLVSGVVWLVRNGTNYVNESMKIECSDNEDTGGMKTFVEVLSARSAIGHDAKGQLILAHIEGQTHMRGANLYEFADLLIRKGVVNAINLDGGGSTTFVQDDLLMNYPTDHCYFDGIYRCPREVSTIVCVHEPECLEANCAGRGSCDNGTCRCNDPWAGETCHMLDCSLVNCSGNGECIHGKCNCGAGWTGDFCNETCPNNRYGPNCVKSCYCYGHSHCHPVHGNCTCEAGFTGSGTGCWAECSEGHYGPNCLFRCVYPDCSGHGTCSKKTGICECHEGWSGISCNDTVVEPTTTPPRSELATPTSLQFPYVTDTPTVNNTNEVLTSTVTMETRTTSCSIRVNQLTAPPSVTTITTSVCDSVSISNPPFVDSTPHQSVVAIVIVTALSTVLVHVVLCVIMINCRSVVGVAGHRSDMRREVMERRQWQRMVQFMANQDNDSDT